MVLDIDLALLNLTFSLLRRPIPHLLGLGRLYYFRAYETCVKFPLKEYSYQQLIRFKARRLTL
jgi:hypothetical protein